MTKAIYSGYQLVVGLEVHIQLSTDSKLFAADANAYGDAPNTNIGVITLAHPGIMPKLNRKAVEYAIRMGLACNCEISRYCFFDRKNYFYPDLPKGFQTTQDKTPICQGGEIPVSLTSGTEIFVKLNRIHLEEDAGKSIHDEATTHSKIDLNRAGVPLIELVTEPVITSSEEAMGLLTEIRQMVRYLEICDGNMERGSLRCDANISIKKKDDLELGKKVEVKNMNSIRNVGRAIEFEFERQAQLLEKGENIISETRLFDASNGSTSGMRTKEELNDYRYFPEPDLSPFEVSDVWLEKIKKEMPVTPKQLKARLMDNFKLSEYDAGVLTSSKELASFFLETCKLTDEYKQVANWINGPIRSALNEQNGEDVIIPLKVKQLADLVNSIRDKRVSNSLANKKVLPRLLATEKSVDDILSQLAISSKSADEISDVILQLIEAFPDKVKAYKNGKKNLMGMFMGEVMKRTNGNADPQKTNELLKEALDK